MFKENLPYIHNERTLSIIKPDIIHYADKIEEFILGKGFSIIQKRHVHLTPEQASEFYAEHYGKISFPTIVSYISSGPIEVLIIARENAISIWRELLGPQNVLKAKVIAPESLRAVYGTDDQQNGLHGSDSFTSAEREIRFFFPNTVVLPIPVRLAVKDYLAKNVNPTLLKALTEMCKEKPKDTVLWLSDWLLKNNPNKPHLNDIVTFR
ncbi:Nucleoside diphosphate kinase 5 isoform 2 [Schistosoma japonicum]|uniref:Nucleoside diphosphate kinase homolog 5 n=2 Tax=Schistosoma japonicum TaxID=6182 RepID=C1LEL0_SCHJA|nr:Nucleoside diphosphate kinase like [Schistosoma japonicum]TNN05203.1 Nucleoside diphosphate kinase 5 isoform 2 [Schistosoma japonicum]CAX73138.1 nucleoside-diphosphate kinase [Schistosoma japonicum]